MARMVKRTRQSPAVRSMVETIVQAEDMVEIMMMGAGHLDHFSDLVEEDQLQVLQGS